MIWLENCSFGVKQQSLTHYFYNEKMFLLGSVIEYVTI